MLYSLTEAIKCDLRKVGVCDWCFVVGCLSCLAPSDVFTHPHAVMRFSKFEKGGAKELMRWLVHLFLLATNMISMPCRNWVKQLILGENQYFQSDI